MSPSSATGAVSGTSTGLTGPSLKLKNLEMMLDNALKAYNDGNWKVFYADFSKRAEALKTEHVFKLLFGEETKAKFGKYVKRRAFLSDKSVLSGEAVVAQWDAEFEKLKNGKITCNLLFEEGKYRFVQISFAD
jgi:hypothetical protein